VSAGCGGTFRSRPSHKELKIADMWTFLFLPGPLVKLSNWPSTPLFPPKKSLFVSLLRTPALHSLPPHPWSSSQIYTHVPLFLPPAVQTKTREGLPLLHLKDVQLVESDLKKTKICESERVTQPQKETGRSLSTMVKKKKKKNKNKKTQRPPPTPQQQTEPPNTPRDCPR